MRLRNNIFAAAFDYLKREKGIKTQKQLAQLMGVSEDTITRILKDRTEVTEDIITKLQTASGCIFNLQWLRGESDVMLVADIKKNDGHATEATSPSSPDMSSLINSIIAAKDDAITSLKRELASKDETIAAKDETIATKEAAIADKDAVIKALQQQVSDLRAQLAIQKGLSDGYPYPVGVAEHDQRTAKRP